MARIGSSGNGGSSSSAYGPVTVVNVNTGYTITSAQQGYFFNVDASAEGFEITLPIATAGFWVRITDSTGYFSPNIVTLEPASGTVLIEGIAGGRHLQTAWGSWLVYSDGTNWFLAS
jgi:hypothetical protein